MPRKQDHGKEEEEQVSLMQQYFHLNFQKVSNFQIKKFNSEKFDPNQIGQMDLEKNMDSLVEELTQEDKEKDLSENSERD